jgi:hypothetical protein
MRHARQGRAKRLGEAAVGKQPRPCKKQLHGAHEGQCDRKASQHEQQRGIAEVLDREHHREH